MITAGLDIGTGYVKAVISDNGRISGYACRKCSEITETVNSVLDAALVNANIKKRNISRIAATGYGGGYYKKASFALNESACIAKAVSTLNKDIKMVIDVGALFIKVIMIRDNGMVDDAYVNEPCASGSGKFIELVAEALDVPLEKISDYAQSSTQPYNISSSCAVFAESEVISRINCGTKTADIFAGVLDSIALRVLSLTGKAGKLPAGGIALTGGVSRIPAFYGMIEKHIGQRVSVLTFDAQMIPSYGASLLAQMGK